MNYLAGLLAVTLLCGFFGIVILWEYIATSIDNIYLSVAFAISPLLIALFLVVSYVAGRDE